MVLMVVVMVMVVVAVMVMVVVVVVVVVVMMVVMVVVVLVGAIDVVVGGCDCWHKGSLPPVIEQPSYRQPDLQHITITYW